MKYGEWLTEWLNNYVKISAKYRTIERYSEIINNHLIPSVGDMELQELTPIILQRYISELLKCGNKRTGDGLSSSAVNSIITVIQNSLHTAYNLRYIDDMVGDKLKRPKMVEKQVECFSLLEQKKIEQAVKENAKPHMIGVLICLYTGLRIGELLALEWRDIDFSNGTLMVDKTCHYGKNGEGQFTRVVDSPKTETSIRLIPLPKQIVPMLKEHKKISSPLVISKNGEGISNRTYQRNFESLLKSLNLKHRGSHALRHTFATRALECGMDVKTLSELLGHKSPAVTLKKYAHTFLIHKKEMMNRLGKMLN